MENYYNINPMGAQDKDLLMVPEAVPNTQQNSKWMYRMKSLFTRYSLGSLLVAVVLIFGLQNQISAQITFNYTGSMQTFIVPPGVTSITIDAYGAQGGDGANGASVGVIPVGGTGGLGAKASGTLAVTPGQVLNIFVGGQGGVPTGGYNGGGFGGASNTGGGGGASDVRVGGVTPADRVITAGGGGGGGRGGCEGSAGNPGAGGNGGSGGGAVGQNGNDSPTSGGFAGGGFGGNASAVQGAGGGAGIGCGGFLGIPGITTVNEIGGDGGGGQVCCCFSASAIPGGGGGGGGHLGGGGGGGGSAGTAGCSGNDKGAGGGGGGGSSYIGGVTAGSALAGVQFGNGQVVITLCPAVNINTQPINTTACENGSVSFTIQATSAASYQWQVNDGFGWVNASGGVYSGDTDSTLNITGVTLAMNGYSYRVIASGCGGEDTSNVVTLTVQNLVATASTIANATCNGYPNGSVTVIASGGTAPYTYSWSPGGSTNATVVGLTANTYTVTVTDVNGCQDTDQAIVTQPAAFNVSSSQANVSCNGGNNGTATVNISGGTPPYTYDWSPGIPTGDGTNSVSGLVAGNYSVLITDGNGCQTTQLFTITQPAVLVASAGAESDVSCNGAADGSATVSVTGGTPGYSYSWAPSGGTAATATGLSPNTYTVTVTDLKGCTDTETFTITEPAPLVASSGGQVDVLCFGGATGAATVNVSGGTPGYNYLWSDGQTTQTAVNLAAGTYNVDVTDANGCTTSQGFTITEPASAVDLTALSDTISPCPNVSASVNPATGGVGPYTYDWTPGSPAGDGTTTVTGLTPGTYTCTVTDANGCTDSQDFVINDDLTPPTAIAQDITVTLSPLGTVSILASQVDNGSNDVCGIDTITVSPDSFTCANTGANNVTLTVTDINGNVSTVNAVVTVQDIENPVITAPNDTTINTSADCGFVLTYTGFTSAFDPSNWNLVNTNGGIGTVLANDSTIELTGSNNGSNTPSFTNYETTIPSDGTMNFDWDYQTFDAPGWDVFGYNVNGVFTQLTAGIGVTESGSVSVNLLAGDVFSFSMFSLDNLFGAAVSIQSNFTYALSGNPIGTALATDNCSVTVTNDAPAVLPIGNTTVTWTATDASGNTSTDTQIVTVQDITAPTVIAQDITVQLDNAGNISITAAQVDNGSSDICGIDSMGVSPSSFTCANVGNNPVTLTVIDIYGNTSTANVTVTVEDVTAPSITCPSNVTVSNDAGLCSASGVVLGSLINSDACGVDTVYNDAPSIFPVGITTVTWTATDVNGNTSTCTQTVTVNDTENPVIVCMNDTVLCGSQVVNYALPTFTDNCSIAIATPLSFTQSLSNLITPLNSVSCNSGGLHTNNSYWRVYDLAALGVTADYTINNITFGIEEADGALGTQPITLNVYTLSGTFVPANLTLVATENLNVPDQTLSVVTAPLSTPPTVPANSTVVLELFTPDGQGPGNTFFIGSNNLGQTGASYISALSCGVVNPTDLASIGFGNMHIVLGMDGVQGGSALSQTAGLPSGATFPIGTTTNTYVVTDLAGNTDTCSFDVIVNPIPTASVSDQTLCHNSMTTATSFGGVDTVYTWTNSDPSIGLAANGTGEIPAFAATNNGLAPVVATIEVTPSYTNAGLTCTGIPVTFTITVNPNPSTTASHTDVTCFGFTDGTATVVASGGTPGYTYLWSPSGGTASIETGLGIGTYYVTVTDTNGCTATDSVTIIQPSAMAVVPSQTNVSCFAGSDGAATVSVSGGTAPYTYLWSNGQTDSTITGLLAGPYSVTITDDNGCFIVQNFTITQPTLINVLPTSNNVSCFGGSDGSASVAVSGGTPGYTYSWSPGGAITPSISGLTAGTYTATITDANGCIATQSFVITEPAPLSVIMSSTLVSCNGLSDGSATAAVSGGTAPYIYSWSNGGTNPTELGLAAGSYWVNIVDAKGCTISDTVIVGQPPVLVASNGGTTNVSCFGGNNGTATVSVTGGTPGYTYSWTSGGTAATETGLIAGSYTVTVTDANGCSTTQGFIITEPTLLVADSVSQTNVSCNGNADGTATVIGTGGTPGYTYLWSNGQTTATATGLAAGAYSVTVTDTLGCTAVANFTITQPATLVASNGGQTEVSCFGGSNGTATVSVTGGTMPYSYSWSPFGGTAATAINLSAGSYTVTVTDFNGCITTQSFTITEPPLLVATSVSQINVSCFGGSDGEATVSASGGTPGYTYLWSTGGTGTTETGLAAGLHYVTVTDALGCTDSTSFIITEPTLLTTTMFQTPVSCNGGIDGEASVVPAGGTPGYTYLWSTGATTQMITNLFAGTYWVNVTDANGCSTSDTVEVTEPLPYSITGFSTNVTCFGAADGTASVTVSGATAPYTYSWAPYGGTGPVATGLVAGVYTVTIKDANGCTIQTSYTITEPNQLVITPSQTDALCNGSSDGTATASVSGGTGPYIYNWSNGASTPTATGLSAGTYSVTVTDINGCIVIQSYTITEPTPVVAGLGSQTNVSCFGGSDGALTVAPSGGTPGYTYLWSTGSTSATISGLTAGSYTITVTDANGCTGSQTFIVTEPTQLMASAAQTNMDCAGDANGEATVTATDGTPGYTYLWSDGQTSATAVGLVAGNYTVDVTDANGCMVTAAVTINEFPVYSGLVQNNVICQGDSVVFGGTAYYNTGLYPFTFTTVNGCDSTVTLDLLVNPVYAGGTEVATICQGDVYMFGGTGYTLAGNYPHTFSTINGCDSTVTLLLFVNPMSLPIFNVTACDNYTFMGNLYTSSGTHTYNFTNQYGCDSIITLNLTINPSYNHVQNSEICQGDNIFFGNNLYSIAGSYPHTFNAVNGCDSTVTLNLTVHPVYAGGIQTETICDGGAVVFGGNTYTVAGNYPHTFSTIYGCDSTVTLNLIVNPVYAGGIQTEVICQGQSVTFGGTVYSATGLYPFTFTTVNGCDSTVTLDLTVNPTYAGGIQNSAICQGDNINFGGTLYTTAGFYPHTFQTINGCDSTVTMHLTVYPASATSLTVSACTSYTLNGIPYSVSGVYTQNFSNVYSCDSIVTLNLTINPAYTGGTETATICQGSSYHFGGVTYTNSGSFPHTFHTVNGCDSTVTLNLTVNPSYSGGIQTEAICDGDFFVFGGSPYATAGLYPHTFTTVNGCDSVVTLELTVNPVYAGGIQTETICNGDNVVFGGTTYTAAGMYPHTFTTVNGCDSTVTLNLIVNPTYAGGIQNTTICQGSNINFGGTLYNTTGTYTHTFSTINGCDSTVTLFLTVKPTSSVSLTASACTSYTLNGQLYTSSGVYTQAYTNVFGCDSTVTLNLTINPAFVGGVQNETICQGSGFTFAGTTYTTSGSYTHNFHTINGCDSIVTLNLTVNPSYSGGVQTTVLCQGQTVLFGGTTYGTTGVYTHTFTTVNGCDSTVTLALTVNPVYTGGTQNNVICQGQSVTFGGTTYTTTGSYTHTFQTVNGCDSTVTLNLIVNPTYNHVQNSVICDGDIITFGGTTYTDAGSYVHVFQTVNGCDSTVTMNLSVNPLSATSMSAVACNTYTLNGQTYTSSGTYTQAFTNVYGCDSILTLNLIINLPTTHTITATACGSYTINGQTYTTSGSYNQSFINHLGCDSTLTLVLTINHVNVGVTQNGATLTADLAGATYQWINCATGMPIMGDTTQTLNVKVNGTYAVVITDANGCTDTSACITVNNMDIDDISVIDANVFPNPNEGDFTIQLGATFPEINVELYDMHGKLIMRRQWYNTDVMYVSEVLASGIYQVRVTAGTQNWVKTIIRK